MIEIAKLGRHAKLFDTGQTDKQGRKIYRTVIQKGQHYFDPNTGRFEDFVGNWEYDSTLDNKGQIFGHKVKKADHNLRLFSKSKKKALRFGFLKGVSVEYDLPNIEPNVSGNIMTFVNVWQYCDLKYTAFPEGIKGDIILKQPGHPASFSFPVTLTGCTAAKEGNALVFYSKGEPVGRIKPPYAVDANGEIGPAALSYDGANVVITPDAGWLSSAVYPVVVDPTTTLQPDPAGGIDTFIVSSSPDSSQGSWTYFLMGYATSSWRTTLIKPPLPDGVQANQVVAATMNLVCNTGVSNISAKIKERLIASDWNESVTWNTAPLLGTIFAELTLSRINLSRDITHYYQNYNGYGLAYETNDTSATNQIGYFSSDYTTASFRPQFIIDYTESASTVGASVFGSINALGRRLIA